MLPDSIIRDNDLIYKYPPAPDNFWEANNLPSL